MKGIRSSINRVSILLGGVAVFALAVTFQPMPAFATDVNAQLFPFQLNQLSDNSAESLLNCSSTGTDCSVAGGVPGGSGPTTLEVGDKLVGIFTIHTVEDLTGGGGTHALGAGSGNNELTGVFSIQVASKTSGGGCPNAFCFTFTSSATYANDIQTACGGTCVLPTGITGAPGGTMASFFDDPATDYSRLNPGGRPSNLASAYGGSLYAYFGFTGAGGTATGNEFWQANASTDDIAVLKNIAPPTPGGAFNMGLTRLAGGIMVPIELVNCTNGQVNMCGQGGLLGIGGANTDWHSFDNVDLVIRPIPEPGSVLLIGTGLAGLGLWRLRRNRSAKA